ncbi:MAG: glycine betaine ABC transporter substrate-binding protein, partial [Fibrobacterota bacterium]
RDIYPADACEIVSREGFAEDFPEAHTFLSNFKLTEEQLYSLMDAVANAESGQRTEAAEEWFDENRQLVESWMPQN